MGLFAGRVVVVPENGGCAAGGFAFRWLLDGRCGDGLFNCGHGSSRRGAAILGAGKLPAAVQARLLFPARSAYPVYRISPTGKNQPATGTPASGRESTPALVPRTQCPPTAVKARGRRHPSSGQEVEVSTDGQPPAESKGPSRAQGESLQSHGHHLPNRLNDWDPAARTGVRQVSGQTPCWRGQKAALGARTRLAVTRGEIAASLRISQSPNHLPGVWGPLLRNLRMFHGMEQQTYRITSGPASGAPFSGRVRRRWPRSSAQPPVTTGSTKRTSR